MQKNQDAQEIFFEFLFTHEFTTMKKPVCLNDPTSHGGKVITASSSYSFEGGRKAALKDDLVSCPIHGNNPIIETGEGFTDEGRPLVVDGCRTQCGSIVIAQDPGVTIA
jgi:uncharacterized Zn-binding protein involved in type VI secretion